jgi:hypothetical protein
MSQVVEAHILQARLSGHSPEGVGQDTWVNWLAFNTGKNEVIQAEYFP